MQTTVTIDGHELDEAQAADFRAADESLRKSYAGLDVGDILPEVERSLGELGAEVPQGTAREYAQHIADRADYELVLDRLS